MTVETRDIKFKEFDHIIAMLELDPEDNKHKLLMAQTKNKERSVTVILKSDEKQLTSLSSPDTDGKVMQLNDWEVKELMNINMHSSMKLADDKYFTLMNIDAIVFEHWKLELAYIQHQHSVGDVNVTPPPCLSSDCAPTNNYKTSTPAESFKRGITRRSTLCNSLKDEKHCDNWRRYLVAIARAHGIDDVLDINKSPVAQEEKDLFAEKKRLCFLSLSEPCKSIKIRL